MFPRMLIFVAGVVALAMIPLSLFVVGAAESHRDPGQVAPEPLAVAYDVLPQLSPSYYQLDMTGGTNSMVVAPTPANINFPPGSVANPLDQREKADPRYAVSYHDEVQVKDAALRPEPQVRPQPQPQRRVNTQPQRRTYPQGYSQRQSR